MRASESSPLLERMTDDARKAITLALEESRAAGDVFFGTEHLLLGLLRHQDAFAARALVSLGVTLEDAREQVDTLIEDKYKEKHEDRKARAARQLREDWRDRAREATFTPRPETVFELALRQAEISGRYYIGTVPYLYKRRLGH